MRSVGRECRPFGRADLGSRRLAGLTQSTAGNYIVYNFLARETSQWNKSLYENVYCSREPMVVKGSRVKGVIYTIKNCIKK